MKVSLSLLRMLVSATQFLLLNTCELQSQLRHYLFRRKFNSHKLRDLTIDELSGY